MYLDETYKTKYNKMYDVYETKYQNKTAEEMSILLIEEQK